MTSITSISAASAAAAYRIDPAPPVRRDVAAQRDPATDAARPEIPTESGWVNSGRHDPDMLDRVSALIDLPAKDVQKQAKTATDLVSMIQNRGVDVGQLRNVMSSGDLLDVRA